MTRLLEVLLDRIAVAVIATDMAGWVTHRNARAVALDDWSRAAADRRANGRPRRPSARDETAKLPCARP